MRNIPFASFTKMHSEIAGELNTNIKAVVKNNWFIGGSNNTAFEQEYAAFCGTKYSIGCGNGLDALKLILYAADIGEGDEVIVPAHTFIATALAVSYVGAKPVFVDVEPIFYCLDPDKLVAAITPRTKAIIMVHIFGQVGRFDEVAQIAKAHKLLLIEDSAQAHGADYKGRRTGSLGDAAGFSFYPGKNLGAFGDAGGVTTDSEKITKMVRVLGNYGSETKYQHEYMGVNSRLDELQAAVLRTKLPNLMRWIMDRRETAQKFLDGINNGLVRLPKENPDGLHTWHIFAVMAENRDAFISYLGGHGISTQIHYPVPMHLHHAYKHLGYRKGQFPVAQYIAAHEVSLPIYYGMEDNDVQYIIDVVNRYRR